MQIAIDVTLDYRLPSAHDVLLQIEAAAMADQRIVESNFLVTSPERLRAVPGEESIGQRTWAYADRQLQVSYHALVDVDRPVVDLASLSVADPRDLPALVVPYLLPSRYCQADKLESFVHRRFADTSGGAKVVEMRDWIARNVEYASGTSSSETTAADTFTTRTGVCRDFAHLLASFARAAMIPARLVSAYAPGVEPPDFHAVVEVWLEDGWHLLDATGMAKCNEIVRIGVGRDATDIAFMTIFGSADMVSQIVNVRRNG
ncbi:Transglutaminase-like domain-containing protein [Sphingomonas antarctica]|uniref:transglutaminase-like domain-containing protein n=1 Tax=Sphingomonas antarctica TaxID=2040274 RepID=UPI0039EBAECC